MRDHDDDAEITCNCLPLTIFPWHRYCAVDHRIQTEVGIEILKQLNDVLGSAVRNNIHPHRIVRILANAERLIAEYTAVNFHELLPLQAQIGLDLDDSYDL